MWLNPQKTEDLVIFTEEILMENLRDLHLDILWLTLQIF